MYIFENLSCKYIVYFVTLLAKCSYFNSVYSNIALIIVSVILFSALYCQIARLILTGFPMRIIIEILPEIGAVAICLLFLIFNYGNRNRYEKLILYMVEDSSENKTSKEESELQNRYDKRALMLIKIITMAVVIISPLIPLLSFVPQLLDIVMPLNESRSRTLPFHGKHFLDEHEYFYVLLSYQTLTLFAVVGIVGSIEGFFVMGVFHVCGMFGVIGYKMEHLFDVEYNSKNMTEEDCKRNMIYRIGQCVGMQQRVFEFIAIMTTAANTLLLLQTVVIIVDVSLLLVQLTNIELINVKCALFSVGQLAQFGLVCLMGQLIINESEKVPQKVYNARWYDVVPDVQKLFTILLMRAYKPCAIIAYNVYVLSLYSYGTVTQTAISYFMVLRQFQ